MSNQLPPARRPGDTFKSESAWLTPQGRIVFARLTRRGQGAGKRALWLVWSRDRGERSYADEREAREAYAAAVKRLESARPAK